MFFIAIGLLGHDHFFMWLVQFMSMRRESGRLTIGDLASKMSRLKVVGENLSEDERASYIQDLYQNTGDEVDFELFLKVSFFVIWV